MYILNTGDEDPQEFTQNVVAVDGFAYGVIGADIHVFGDSGVPLYLLADWQPPGTVDAEWLREMPSRMLNAHFAVVEFTGRDQELAELRQWRDRGPRLGVRWLYGPGGQGKTRLATQTALEALRDGWKVVTAIHGPGAILERKASQDLRIGRSSGLLVIVDYADRWTFTHINWLLSNSIFQQPNTPTRVLMVARTLDLWPTIRAGLANQQAGTSSLFLEPLPEGSQYRGDMFVTACASFAGQYGIDITSLAIPSQLLRHRDFGLILALHMAALVVVDSYSSGSRPPEDMTGMTIYLLDREQSHWMHMFGDSALELNPDDRPYRTKPEVMNSAVFVATMAGPVARSAGAALLEHTQPGIDPHRIMLDHSACYPPTVKHNVLEPIYPDRLAEDFIALTLPGHKEDYPDQPWAPTTASTVIEAGRAPGNTDFILQRTITYLASAAQRWAHVGRIYLYPKLAEMPRLAIEAGSAALAAIANIPDVDFTVLEAINSELPEGVHADLGPGIVAVAARVTEHRLEETSNQRERARLYRVLARRQVMAGMHHEAIETGQRALRCLCDPTQVKDLAQILYVTHDCETLHTLAGLLHILGTSFGAIGESESAAEMTGLAVGSWRALNYLHPDKHSSEYASALNNLGLRMWQVGRGNEARYYTEQALQIWRMLSEKDPSVTNRAECALSLSNLSMYLGDAGLYEQALRTEQEALDIWQEIIETDMPEWQAEYVRSLDHLASHLASLGRYDEAVQISMQALKLHQHLIEVNPRRHEPGYAESIEAHSKYLSKAGRAEEATDASTKAITVYRRLADKGPDAYKWSLARALDSLSDRLIDAGRAADANDIMTEAVDISRHAGDPDGDDGLAWRLFRSGINLAKSSRYDDALHAFTEAIHIVQRLESSDLERYSKIKADIYLNISSVLSALERKIEAIRTLDEVVSLCQGLVNPNGSSEFILARALLMRADVRTMDENSETLKDLSESVAICKELVPGHPDIANDLVQIFVAQAGLFQRLGYRREAAKIFRSRFMRENLASVLTDQARVRDLRLRERLLLRLSRYDTP